MNPACIASPRARTHKPYEYGNKVSVATTATGNVIVGVVSHETNMFDGHTLPDILSHVETSRGKAAKTAVCDRGYRGTKIVDDTRIILPSPSLKRDSRRQRDQKRKRCRRRAAIEPVIGHLKADFRMARNYLKGTAGDIANAILAATAWNLRLWLRAFLAFIVACLTVLLKMFQISDGRRQTNYSFRCPCY